MPTVRIYPTDILDLRNTLFRMMLHIDMRRNSGWPAFQPDELWEYISERDLDVCPYCDQEDKASPHEGTLIPLMFPNRDWEFYPRTLNPRYHTQLLDKGILGFCRCTMEWIDMLGTLTDRLAMELDSI